ncbi:MAG: hypothetical protein IT293_16250 [Deltaproteobacteria bacterium]|nr:hypothetical protein [Deltaproteobacteria bacterium]
MSTAFEIAMLAPPAEMSPVESAKAAAKSRPRATAARPAAVGQDDVAEVGGVIRITEP